MGETRQPVPVCLLCAVFYSDEILKSEAVDKLVEKYGAIERASEPFSFSETTTYYEKEMGDNLQKQYLIFEEHIDPVDIADIKLVTNDIESEYAIDGQRQINLDPGYIELPKLVLATTKNFSHRIYIGKGIYGDVQLSWRDGHFQPYPWTYPDYRDPKHLAFFETVRKNYLKYIQEENSGR